MQEGLTKSGRSKDFGDVYPVFWTPVTQDGKETGIWERDTHRR
jgi:hypothetical protein